jgi:hypothetical protein
MALHNQVAPLLREGMFFAHRRQRITSLRAHPSRRDRPPSCRT